MTPRLIHEEQCTHPPPPASCQATATEHSADPFWRMRLFSCLGLSVYVLSPLFVFRRRWVAVKRDDDDDDDSDDQVSLRRVFRCEPKMATRKKRWLARFRLGSSAQKRSWIALNHLSTAT
ncbi:unnamed protein product [Aphanomyces euteiches]|nr:hypothetical protein Ae201684P_017992 [Aphanomyces euteiches]